MFRKLVMSAAAAALAMSSVAASAAQTAGAPASTASKLSLSSAAKMNRASTPVANAQKFGGDSTLLLILAVILIGAGIFVLADNNDDSPTSP